MWRSPAAQLNHNQLVVSSNLTIATNFNLYMGDKWEELF